MHDVRPRPGEGRRRDHGLDRPPLRDRRPGRDERVIGGTGRHGHLGRVLRVHDHRRPRLRERGHRGPERLPRQRRELGDPRVDEEALEPDDPGVEQPRELGRFPGTAPPQNATSTAHCPAAAATLARSASTVVVTGEEFSGMSQIVVTPPARAARVAVANPSHSVRPGSLTCTCESTSPGSSGRSPRSTVRSASRCRS